MHVLRAFVFTLAFSLCLTAALQAQEHATDRGSYILGGAAGFTSHRIGDTRSSYLYLNPNVQYFVRPGFAIGGTASLSRSSYKDESITAYGAGPQVSYYPGSQDQELRPYVSARAVISDMSRADHGIATYGGNVGLLYLITRSVGLDASLFYNRTSDLGGRGPRGGADVLGLAVGFSAFAF